MKYATQGYLATLSRGLLVISHNSEEKELNKNISKLLSNENMLIKSILQYQLLYVNIHPCP